MTGGPAGRGPGGAARPHVGARSRPGGDHRRLRRCVRLGRHARYWPCRSSPTTPPWSTAPARVTPSPAPSWPPSPPASRWTRALARAPVNSMRVVQHVGSQAGLLDDATSSRRCWPRPPEDYGVRDLVRSDRRAGDPGGGPPRPGPLRSPPVPRPPLLLVPPSEGKAPGGAPARPSRLVRRRAGGTTGPPVLAALARAVAGRGTARQVAVLGVRGELLDRALAATAALTDGTAPVLPAWRRYTGVVWAGLDPATLRPADRHRVLVPSALYGMTTAADPVADYRLKILVALGGLGRLSTYWRPAVTAALAARARGRVVIDLLPAEHEHALDLGGPGPGGPGGPGPVRGPRRPPGRGPRGQGGQGTARPRAAGGRAGRGGGLRGRRVAGGPAGRRGHGGRAAR